jgi:hypothetical protein
MYERMYLVVMMRWLLQAQVDIPAVQLAVFNPQRMIYSRHGAENPKKCIDLAKNLH